MRPAKRDRRNETGETEIAMRKMEKAVGKEWAGKTPSRLYLVEL
jgi:hypothetical protein